MVYMQGVRTLDRQTLISFWFAIATVAFGQSSQKATAIRDHLYRYIHRIIACSIMPRYHSRDKVNMGDFFFLYYMLRPKTCVPATSLAEYFATAYHWQERDRLFGRSYVKSDHALFRVGSQE
ncbi:hypothetical protein Hanom_Chr10g00908371 [Helianthus anomalus]